MYIESDRVMIAIIVQSNVFSKFHSQTTVKNDTSWIQMVNKF